MCCNTLALKCVGPENVAQAGVRASQGADA
jgi:hypothetical protein